MARVKGAARPLAPPRFRVRREIRTAGHPLMLASPDCLAAISAGGGPGGAGLQKYALQIAGRTPAAVGRPRMSGRAAEHAAIKARERLPAGFGLIATG